MGLLHVNKPNTILRMVIGVLRLFRRSPQIQYVFILRIYLKYQEDHPADQCLVVSLKVAVYSEDDHLHQEELGVTVLLFRHAFAKVIEES